MKLQACKTSREVAICDVKKTGLWCSLLHMEWVVSVSSTWNDFDWGNLLVWYTWIFGGATGEECMLAGTLDG